MNVLSWLQEWFLLNCDGDWEHENQIKIETVSNPGWFIVIDFTNTTLENLPEINHECNNGSDDWYFYNINKFKFTASGDVNKLEYLLQKFREIVESFKDSEQYVDRSIQ